MIGIRILFVGLIISLIILAVSLASAQPTLNLQIIMIGSGQGPYYAPAGQTTQLKVEIFNPGPGDIYLNRGDEYLDPSLSGNWQLIHSESLGNFHLTKLTSAIWTFNLTVPPSAQASNATNGVPQVVLLIKITFSTANGQVQVEQAEFQLSVPGAVVTQLNQVIWIVGAAVVVLVVGVFVYRRKSKLNQNGSA
jgi:hypothetical protein